MERVLITGGAGFIGYHLAKKLSDLGSSVVLTDNFARGVMDPALEELAGRKNVEFVEANLLENEEVEKLDAGFTHIYHLAAIIGVRHVLRAPYEVLSGNTKLLANMVEFAKKQKDLHRFIFTSTSEIYAGTLKHFSLEIPTRESTPLAVTDLNENRTSYMLSKIYGEAMCLHSGIPVTIIRPHNFYGPRMGLSHVIPELFRKAMNEETLEIFSPTHSRTFCYIEDAVNMITALARLPGSMGEAYNVGNQQPELTIMELAQKIIRTAGTAGELIPGPVTPGSPTRRCPDMEKTLKATGYTPHVDIDEGLRKTLEWYMANVFNGKGISAI